MKNYLSLSLLLAALVATSASLVAQNDLEMDDMGLTTIAGESIFAEVDEDEAPAMELAPAATYTEQDLKKAARDGDLDEVRTILASGQVDINAGTGKWGGSALVDAARKGHLDIVKYLVEQGANINAKGRGGQSALSVANKFGHVEVADYLTNQGATA